MHGGFGDLHQTTERLAVADMVGKNQNETGIEGYALR